MIRRVNSKKILMAVMVLGLLSCKKKEEPATKEEETTSTPNPCFNNNYNGTYHGYGSTSVGPFSSGTLVILKTGCQTCSMDLTSNGGNFSDNVTQLTLNSSGGFDGKLSNGNNVSISLGTHITVKAVGSYTYTGQK